MISKHNKICNVYNVYHFYKPSSNARSNHSDMITLFAGLTQKETITVLNQICEKIYAIENLASSLYTTVYNMFDQFVRPAGVAMPAIVELIKAKRKYKSAVDPDYKERGWRFPHSEWLIELDNDGLDERMLKEMTRTQVADIISRRQESWGAPVIVSFPELT